METSLLVKCKFNIIVHMNDFAQACLVTEVHVKHHLELTSAVDWNLPINIDILNFQEFLIFFFPLILIHIGQDCSSRPHNCCGKDENTTETKSGHSTQIGDF